MPYLVTFVLPIAKSFRSLRKFSGDRSSRNQRISRAKHVLSNVEGTPQHPFAEPAVPIVEYHSPILPTPIGAKASIAFSKVNSTSVVNDPKKSPANLRLTLNTRGRVIILS